MNQTHQINCAHCKGKHNSVGEVKDCARGIRPASQPAPVATVAQSGLPGQVPMVTQRQLEYIEQLGGDPVHAAKYTMKGASLYIDRLKREGKTLTQAPNPGPEPVKPKTKIPLEFLTSLREGYYASRPDSDHEYTFFRVSWPNRGNFKGALKIQRQSGPDYDLMLVVWPGGRIYSYKGFTTKVEDDLLLVTVDQRGCAMAYADKIGRCMRCNTELTDARSRWFGIGPECEKHWPEMIDEVTEIKGPFKYGQDD